MSFWWLGDWTNTSLNNPTYEYYPAKNIAGQNGRNTNTLHSDLILIQGAPLLYRAPNFIPVLN
jgi:hypothetical protein